MIEAHDCVYIVMLLAFLFLVAHIMYVMLGGRNSDE